jgi:extracellular factor (EF) 3-hydroxypalmitic acid methyl ester biosynthesis protein
MTRPNLSQHVRAAASQLAARLTAIERNLPAEPQSAEYRDVAEAIDACLATLAQTGLWGPENRLPSSELWNVAGDLLSRGWLQNQARTKPRGYAGDYEMLARIYENRWCDDPLGRLFDQYFQAQAAPQAVRNRMAMITDWIVQRATDQATHDSPGTRHHRLHIAIVGSAFGLEVRDALLRLDEAARARVSVTLLDVDPAAIDFARRELSPLLAAEGLAIHSTNLFRLPDRPAAAKWLDGADHVFCPGMFDYLDDAAGAAMLRWLYERLAAEGRLTVFQFAPHNPTRAYMEWFGNWYLTYRKLADFKQLVAAANLPHAETEYGAEAIGIDLYATLTRPR